MLQGEGQADAAELGLPSLNEPCCFLTPGLLISPLWIRGKQPHTDDCISIRVESQHILLFGHLPNAKLEGAAKCFGIGLERTRCCSFCA